MRLVCVSQETFGRKVGDEQNQFAVFLIFLRLAYRGLLAQEDFDELILQICMLKIVQPILMSTTHAVSSKRTRASKTS